MIKPSTGQGKRPTPTLHKENIMEIIFIILYFAIFLFLLTKSSGYVADQMDDMDA